MVERIYQGAESPTLVKAFHQGLYQQRGSLEGNRYVLSDRRTVTATQGGLNVYFENPTSDTYFVIEHASVVVNNQIVTDTYDEPTVDETTFNSIELNNTRSSVTQDPALNAYVGTDNNVTISDTGRPYTQNYIGAGAQRSITGTGEHTVYIVDPGSSTLGSFSLDTNNDTRIGVTISIHELTRVPDVSNR